MNGPIIKHACICILNEKILKNNALNVKIPDRVRNAQINTVVNNKKGFSNIFRLFYMKKFTLSVFKQF